MIKVLTVLGTRPEAIKLAPVVHVLAQRSDRFESHVCVTGQHREMLDSMLTFFGIRPDFDLALMKQNQSLSDLTARMLQALDPVLAEIKPDWVIVQGDTTTVMVAALAAYYRRIPVAHVEAGLRTSDKYAPFPEEIHRRIAGVMADVHFAPTERAVQNLLHEGVPASQICLCGNTVVDSLLWAAAQPAPEWPPDIGSLAVGRKRILVTGHRRENFGGGLESICQALRELTDRYDDLEFVYPMHMNPNVREPAQRLLGNHPRILLIEPVDYPVMVHLLKTAWLVLTDSGGIQEEAPAFHIPCLVMRDKTERPEGVEAGVAKLVGTDKDRIIQAVTELHQNSGLYARMAQGDNPYGDGQAAVRIADWLGNA